MHTRTMMSELDEVIARAESTVEREAAILDALPDCRLRRRKKERVRSTRAHVHRLRRLRCTMTAGRPLGSRPQACVNSRDKPTS